MVDHYNIDLAKFPLERFRQSLEMEEMLPARQVLKEDLEPRFQILASMGLHNLSDLINALSTKKKMEAFAHHSGLPRDYLVVLRRQARSYLAKPVHLGDIPGVNKAHVNALAAAGIKHSKHLFQRGQTPQARRALSAATGVPIDRLLELVKLSDLSRIGGMGAAYVRLFYEAGADSIETLARWDPLALSEAAHVVKREQRITQVVPSLKDITNYVTKAKELAKVIDYG